MIKLLHVDSDSTVSANVPADSLAGWLDYYEGRRCGVEFAMHHMRNGSKGMKACEREMSRLTREIKVCMDRMHDLGIERNEAI